MTVRSALVAPDFSSITSGSNSVDWTFSPHGDTPISSTTAEIYHYRPPVALSLERLATFEAVASGGTGKTFRAFLNGSASALAVTIPDGGAIGAVTEDTTNSVSVAAGDRLSFVARKTGGTAMFAGHRAVLVAPGSRAVSPLVITTTGATFDNSTRNYPVSGAYSFVSYAVDQRMTVRSPGDWRGLFVNVTANAGSGSSTIRGLLNNADTAMLVSIGPGETGQFFNNTDVIPVVSGDHINYRKTGTTGTSYVVTTIGSSLVNADKKQQLYGYASRAWAPAVINAVSHTGLPGPDYGNSVASTEYAKYERSLGYPARISNLQVAFINTTDVDVVGTMFVNGTATSLSVTIPAGTTSLIEDLVDTVDVGADDKIGFKWTPSGTATTGNFSTRSWSVCIEDLTPEGGSTGNFLLMFG